MLFIPVQRVNLPPTTSQSVTHLNCKKKHLKFYQEFFVHLTFALLTSAGGIYKAKKPSP